MSDAITSTDQRVILAVDLGTQRLKVAAVAVHDWRILAQESCAIPYASTEEGMFEQDPDTWWDSFAHLVGKLIAGGAFEPGRIAAIGLSGHMHSVVLIDEQGRPTRPAIAWADARSHAYGTAVRAGRREPLWNPAIAPYSATKLLWLEDHDPRSLETAKHLVFPKDYLRFRLTGEIATDPSDASGSLLWDFEASAWDADLIASLGLDASWFPDVRTSTAIGGHVTREAAEAIGLHAGVPVAVGSGDVAAALNGHAVADSSGVLINAGTAAQIITSSIRPERFVPDAPARFIFERGAAPGAFAMGALPSAGLSLTWWSSVLANPGGVAALGEAIDLEAGAGAPPYFLPYLQGTGTPMLRDHAAGAFLSLSSASGRDAMTRAVIEGIAYGIRHGLESLGRAPDDGPVAVTGGLARNAAVRHMIPSVLGRTVQVQEQADVSLVGATAYGAVACGAARAPSVVARAMAGDVQRIEPDPARTAKYQTGFEAFRSRATRVPMWTPSAAVE
jgi:xylulokinase